MMIDIDSSPPSPAAPVAPVAPVRTPRIAPAAPVPADGSYVRYACDIIAAARRVADKHGCGPEMLQELNAVVRPGSDQCIARSGKGAQCTRKKKVGEFCGSHGPKSAHGTIFEAERPAPPRRNRKKTPPAGGAGADGGKRGGAAAPTTVQIWSQNVSGVCYYVDDNHNVYSYIDILKDRDNPDVIGTWSRDVHGEYVIAGVHDRTDSART